VSRPEADRVVTAAGVGDAIAVRADPLAGVTVVAIAGAHDPVRGPRSDVGSRIAADIGATKAEAAIAALPSADAAALAPLGGVLTVRVVEQWQAQVLDYTGVQRALDDEGDAGVGVGVDDATAEERDPLRAYATALLVVVVTPAAVLAMQLGAGDVVMATDDGEALRPVGGDPADDPDGEASLARADALAHFRHATFDRTARDVTLVLAATGLDRATADHDPAATLAAELVEQAGGRGIDSIEQELRERLDRTARAGGDGGSVALVFPASAVPVAAAEATDPALAATIANPAVAVPALTTSEIPAVASGATASGIRRRWWVAAAVAAIVFALAIAAVLALTRGTGSTTPATVTSTTPKKTTSTTTKASTSTSPASTAAPSTAPSTTPSTAPLTTVPVVVPTPPPTTAAPPRTTTATRPPATTTAPPTTVPATTSPPTT
jgi:hypothetical protein